MGPNEISLDQHIANELTAIKGINAAVLSKMSSDEIDSLYKRVVKDGTFKVYSITKTISAGASNVKLTKDMDGAVLFAVEQLRGTFTTLETIDTPAPGTIVDYGVNQMSMKITAPGQSDYQFMDNPVKLETLLVPGRVKSPLATNNDTAPASNPIFEPLEDMKYLFTKKIDVLVNNPSAVDQEVSIVWLGKEMQSVR